MLKSTGSSFEGFIRDEFTTLPEAKDRILSTAVDLTYVFPRHVLRGAEDISAVDAVLDVKGAAQVARETTLRVFCEDSASVQVGEVYALRNSVLTTRRRRCTTQGVRC